MLVAYSLWEYNSTKSKGADRGILEKSFHIIILTWDRWFYIRC